MEKQATYKIQYRRAYEDGETIDWKRWKTRIYTDMLHANQALNALQQNHSGWAMDYENAKMFKYEFRVVEIDPKDKPEYIVCSAIWFDDGKTYEHQPFNIETGMVFCGLRHANCFAAVGGTVGERQKVGLFEKEQGFLTSKNRFVDRKDGAKIALASGQIKKLNHWVDELDSSDLY